MAGIWFFLIDIINEFKWFKMPVRWYAIMGPVLLLFGLQEAFLKTIGNKTEILNRPCDPGIKSI